MSNTDPVPAATPPAVVSWYQSKIIQGIITAVVAQTLAHSKLSAIVTSEQAVSIINWILEALSAAATAYALHSRVVGPVPPIAGTKTASAAIAAGTATPPVPKTPGDSGQPPASSTATPK